MSLFRKILFILLALLSLGFWINPPIALLLGLLLSLSLGNPFPTESKKGAKLLLQASVVGLGFGLDLNTVLRVGKEGFLFTLVTIGGTLLLGALLGRLLGIERKSQMLISTGTAICGGSAIAAVGPVLQASEEEMSVSLGTVFILNSVALFLFPWVGHMLVMSQEKFGLWAAIAIHDTSSVVGAATSYGAGAVAVATTVKLTRALWILPVAFFFAWLERKRVRNALARAGEAQTNEIHAHPAIPWFIFLFFLASVARSFIGPLHFAMDQVVIVAKQLLQLTLFLIGAGLSRAVLKKVGVRPLVMGVVLWLIVGISTLVAVLSL